MKRFVGKFRRLVGWLLVYPVPGMRTDQLYRRDETPIWAYCKLSAVDISSCHGELPGGSEMALGRTAKCILLHTLQDTQLFLLEW